MCHLHKEAAQTLQRLHAMLFLQVADRFHEFVALQRTCLIETPSWLEWAFGSFKYIWRLQDLNWTGPFSWLEICNLEPNPCDPMGRSFSQLSISHTSTEGPKGPHCGFGWGEMAAHSRRSKTQVASSLSQLCQIFRLNLEDIYFGNLPALFLCCWLFFSQSCACILGENNVSIDESQWCHG